MPTYEDIRSTTDSYASGGGRWDTERFTRERDERMYRGPAPPPAPLVRERSRSRSRPPPFSERRHRGSDRFVDDRFERRVVEEEDIYGPPGRRRDHRHVEEEDDFYAARGSGPLIHRREHHDDSFRPPRLLRRQSSLDTFDRQPARRIERAPPIRGVRRGPSQRRRPSGGRFVERDEYEEIDIAEPDIYGDEEFRHFRERDRPHLVREELVKEKIVEKDKPYPRKGKTKMPKRLVHPRAVQELGYPYIEEERVIIIQRALSKELIDEVVSLSREIRRRSDNVVYRRYESPSPSVREREFVERVVVASPSPVRAERLYVEESPSPYRYRSPSQVRAGRYLERPEIVESRPRSVSVNYPRPASPVIIERRGEEVRTGPVVMVERPRRSAHDVNEEIRALEDERRMLQIERLPEHSGGVEIIKDKVIHRSDGQTEEVLEVKKDRRPGDSRLIRAMMATLT
ncbi:hypothetical protein UA08_07522 [Talaromyces atroroseus]|uniref:DUF8035 domain-containing protein n=1 Tax=Talaromyces atroroseus TaxID=1441469 RepID=A0A225AAD7_TALAT|nr:hypothetical protein UA08_07522 [Talaromyces atroroseus]OKL57110.1 hypothetical protein UA08_07522 [Talaromyces atroroseus]